MKMNGLCLIRVVELCRNGFRNAEQLGFNSSPVETHGDD